MKLNTRILFVTKTLSRYWKLYNKLVAYLQALNFRYIVYIHGLRCQVFKGIESEPAGGREGGRGTGRCLNSIPGYWKVSRGEKLRQTKLSEFRALGKARSVFGLTKMLTAKEKVRSCTEDIPPLRTFSFANTFVVLTTKEWNSLPKSVFQIVMTWGL